MRKSNVIALLLLVPLFVKGQIISTATGNGLAGYNGDGGLATSAAIGNTGGVIFDKLGNYYFADGNNTVRKVSAAGIITTIAGNGTGGFSGDGGLATSAKLNGPVFIATDDTGNVYISDEYNNRIRKVNVTTGIITTIAGNGVAGFNGDGGYADTTELNAPYGICIDDSNNLYIADHLNYRIRKVNTSGIITTISGDGISGYSGDGGNAINAGFTGIYAICVDDSNNLYVCDGPRVRKINSVTNIINTYAGNGNFGDSGDGGNALNAEFQSTDGLAIDKAFNLYIADEGAYKIRKVNANGIISTVAGIGMAPYNGDGGLADTSEISSPRGVALDTCGNLFISDNGNHRIRKVTYDSTCGKADTTHTDTTNAVQNIQAGCFSVYPNPATNKITITGSNINSVQVIDVLGQVVYNKAFVQQKKIMIDISGLVNGVYFIKVNNIYVEKVLKE